MAYYTGLLGSEATRFLGQDTTDIHFTNRFHPAPVLHGLIGRKYRQRAVAVAQGITMVTAQRLDGLQINAQGEPVEIWHNSLAQLPDIVVTNNGPSQPGFLPPVGHSRQWLVSMY